MLAQDATQQNTGTHHNLAALLDSEILELEQLREVLETEKTVLGGHDVQQTEDTSRQKRKAVSAVEKASLQRIHYLRSAGVNPVTEDWYEHFVKIVGVSDEVRERYDYLASLTNRCRVLNQTNGLMINRRELLTSKVINILRANNTPEIYSDSGQSESASDTRILGKA